jgi:hypothetical protein
MEARLVMPRQVGVELLKVFLATFAAVVVTTVVGMFLGIPQDVDRLEKNIRAFELASYEASPEENIEQRDVPLTNAGQNPNARSSTSSSPLRFKHSVRSLLEGAVRWYPTIFCVALLGFLLLLRAGLLSAAFLILGLAPLSSLLDPGLGLSIAVFGSIYLVFAFMLRKTFWFNGRGYR